MNEKNEITEFVNNTLEGLKNKKFNNRIEIIDKKLGILLDNMEYSDYLNFISSNEKLKLYDDIVGKYSVNYIYTESMVNSLPDSIYSEVEEIIDNKIKELNLK